ncbi:MAG: DUF3119 family protein [Hydrococcus sp. C42_A2020_068]|uniref:DUF3119 family protein n=1 Tax=Pleurocapsa sp. PCC 7327 TaxID=118163 RepID=UPI00029FA1BF|nr:DUF3119 family protein [Pleurocapsa sp. PCC 7327]AFY79478.1 Protein of unknown function (DUF3119) [Pleurocapsa sp. PCC 7327]MBF2021051.1 DUF3119 family protein [Hydrococcus sp. C42_A2020_068]
MTSVQPSPATGQTVELAPSYKIPLVLIVAAIPIAWIQIWVGLVISLFGLFLMLQTATIRLQFTKTALDVYRSGKLIRNFPYAEWQNWKIFWDRVPILFYFREIKSIHFLPILFDPKTLKACLEKYYPLERSN